MGCDIHAMVEAKVHPYAEAWPDNEDMQALSWWVSAGEIMYGDRSYEKFAALANVRNYSSKPVKVIAQPRGIPSEYPNSASDVFKCWVEQWGPDAHSTSWVTLPELEAYGGSLFKHIIRDMKKRKALFKASEVRLCFFFDN